MDEEEQGAVGVSSNTTSTPSTPPVTLKKKYEDKIRKKDPRSWENVTKQTSSLDDEDKMRYIETKYVELYHEIRKLQTQNQQLSKQNTIICKEKDHIQNELTKSIVARSRLENLCRELQKQNKQIKEENLAKIKEEEEHRKQVSLKFADKLNDINNMMDENKEKSNILREENLKMTAKLADLYNQFQKREEDISKMSQQLELERQYSQATLAKMELEFRAEKEIHAKEQALMKSNLEKSEANCSVLLETVKGLQDHIDVYKHQYEDFETTMSKSTKVFDNFKFEIANMSKQVNTLEQEARSWKTKFHDSMSALVEVSEAKKNQELYIQTLDRKIDKLHQVCRQIQVERSSYLKLLKQHGIEPPPTVIPPPKEKEDESGSQKGASAKMTRKEKELRNLKENLKAVQDHLSRISVEDGEKATESSSQGAKTEVQPSVEPVSEAAKPEPEEGNPDPEEHQQEKTGQPTVKPVFGETRLEPTSDQEAVPAEHEGATALLPAEKDEQKNTEVRPVEPVLQTNPEPSSSQETAASGSGDTCKLLPTAKDAQMMTENISPED